MERRFRSAPQAGQESTGVAPLTLIAVECLTTNLARQRGSPFRGRLISGPGSTKSEVTARTVLNLMHLSDAMKDLLPKTSRWTPTVHGWRSATSLNKHGGNYAGSR
jgi:hypothetical protein